MNKELGEKSSQREKVIYLSAKNAMRPENGPEGQEAYANKIAWSRKPLRGGFLKHCQPSTEKGPVYTVNGQKKRVVRAGGFKVICIIYPQFRTLGRKPNDWSLLGSVFAPYKIIDPLRRGWELTTLINNTRGP